MKQKLVFKDEIIMNNIIKPQWKLCHLHVDC